MNSVVCHDASTLASGFLNKTRPCTSVDVSCAADGHPVTHPKALLHPIQIISHVHRLLSHPLPTNEIAKPFLQQLRCKFRHPMMLPTRSRGPKPNPIHQPSDIPPYQKAHKEPPNIEAISAIDAIMHSAPTITPTVIQITPAVPPLTSPYCAASKTLSHVDCSTITKPTMETKRKFRRRSRRLPMRFMSWISCLVPPFCSWIVGSLLESVSGAELTWTCVFDFSFV